MKQAGCGPRNIVRKFEARLGQNLLFTWEPGISISQNPYIEFTFAARESGELVMVWTDEKDPPLEARKTITLS
jgi:sulfur-oxidizing protein SoxZ